MSQSLFNSDVHINGTLSAKLFTPPGGSITNASIQAAAGIDATKVVHQFPLVAQQSGTIATATTLLHIARAAATVVSIEAITLTPATGADRTVTIDLQSSNASTAFASILSAPIVLDDDTDARTVVTAAVASPTLADDDQLQLVVTVAGAAGAQAQGLLVTVTLRESPQ